MIWNFLESAFGDSYHVLFEFKIRNTQLPAALGQSRLKRAVEEDFRFVLTGNHDERTQVLSRFQEGTQRGHRSRARVEFVVILIAAAGHGQFVRAGGEGRKFHTVARHADRRLAIETELDGRIARIHMQVVSQAADHHR